MWNENVGVMKTVYQKLSRYSIDHLVFGKSKKKDYLLYWILIALIFLVGVML